MFKKNTAVTGFMVGLVSATDGSAITTGTPVGYYTLDGGTQTAIADVTPVHEGNGLWSFDLTAGEMNGTIVALTFTHASAIPAHFIIKTDTKIFSDLNDIAATAIVSGGAITTSSGAVSTVTSVTGSVGSVTGAVGSVTGSVGSVTGAINTAAGTITTLDGLDTAQDTQHSTTQSLVTTADAAIDSVATTIGAAGAGLTAVPWNASWDAEVESECNDALVANHLDHLLAVDYDPATPPGVSTALLNEIIESDVGVSRFTANALENAPSGTGASASTIADAVWDEARADHVAAGSYGETIATVETNIDNCDAPISTVDTVVDTLTTNLATTDGKVDTLTTNLATVDGIVDTINANVVTIDSIVDAILLDTGTDGVVISAAMANKIADHVLRRTWTNMEASSDGDTMAFRSLAGAIAKLVNKVGITGSDLIIYKDDDLTTFGTQALTTDAAAEPITSMDTV